MASQASASGKARWSRQRKRGNPAEGSRHLVSPESADAERLELTLIRDDRNVLDQRLSDQKPVKRILAGIGEPPRRLGMSQGNGEPHEAKSLDSVLEVEREVLGL